MGEKLASYCLTEPGAGSDAGSLRTSAQQDGDDYVVNGSKVFISGAGETDVLVVMTRTGDAGPKGVTALLIPADAEGVQYGKKEHKMGWNAQPTRMVTFDNVRVPVSHRLGEEGQGFAIAMEGLDGGRINIATCSVGTAQRAISDATAYVKDRKQFDTAIAEFQHTQFKLADMLTDLVASRQMIRLAASKLITKIPRQPLTVPWPNALPPTRGSRSATMPCSYWVVMVTSRSTHWSAMCAIRGCIKYSKVLTKLCA
jgi:alkylation response protein AidB-like acyl-CoA dehydrogenase